MGEAGRRVVGHAGRPAAPAGSVPGVGRRYAATTRAVTLIPTVVVAVPAADPGAMRLTVVLAMTALTLWSGI
jgi:hypothetical protein